MVYYTLNLFCFDIFFKQTAESFLHVDRCINTENVYFDILNMHLYIYFLSMYEYS